MAIDNTDLKILWNLDYDARISASKLAKKARLSKQSLNYRLNKLKEKGIIQGFMSLVDIHRLGFLTYRTYLRFNNLKNQEKIIDHFNKHNNVLWFVSLNGTWDMEVVFVARNFIHFNNILKNTKEQIGKFISKYNVSMSIVNNHLKRDYLINKKRTEITPNYYGYEPQKEKLDKMDIKLLIELSKNCRRNSNEIGEKIGLTYHSIQNRIKRLEEKKIIQSHRIKIDINRIGKKYFKALIILNTQTKKFEKELYNFCNNKNFVVYLVEVLGEWQFEIEAEVENQEEFSTLIRELRDKFSDKIKDYNILEVTCEHKLNYFPMGKELLKDKT